MQEEEGDPLEEVNYVRRLEELRARGGQGWRVEYQFQEQMGFRAKVRLLRGQEEEVASSAGWSEPRPRKKEAQRLAAKMLLDVLEKEKKNSLEASLTPTNFVGELQERLQTRAPRVRLGDLYVMETDLTPRGYVARVVLKQAADPQKTTFDWSAPCMKKKEAHQKAAEIALKVLPSVKAPEDVHDVPPVSRQMAPPPDTASIAAAANSIGLLQEHLQKLAPTKRVDQLYSFDVRADSTGFFARVIIEGPNGAQQALGWTPSHSRKKDAQNDAARIALKALLKAGAKPVRPNHLGELQERFQKNFPTHKPEQLFCVQVKALDQGFRARVVLLSPETGKELKALPWSNHFAKKKDAQQDAARLALQQE